MRPGLHPEPSKLDHSRLEGPEEARVVRSEPLHRWPRSQVREQHLVGGEQPLAAEQVLEVHVVKGDGRVEVHVDGDGRVDVPWARVHQSLRVGLVQGRVDGVRGVEGVEPVEEAGAVGEADGVRAGERDHVTHGEVVELEEGDEAVEVEVGAWEASGDVGGSGKEAVEAAELHLEAWTAGLITIRRQQN